MNILESGQMQSITRHEYEKKEYRNQLMRDERERQIIGRHNSLSLIQVMTVPHVRSILACSLFIYFKYQMVNHRMLNIDQINEKYTNPFAELNDEATLNKQLYLFIATVFQAGLSFIIAKFLFGRSFTCTYVILFTVTLLDIFESVLMFRQVARADRNALIEFVFLMRSILVYILYFTICQFGVLDIAKIEQLKSSARLHAPLVGIVIAS